MNTPARSKQVGAGVAMTAMLALAGCATQERVVVQKEEVSCTVPAVAVAPVQGPAKLQAGATNEDLLTHDRALETALEKANKRLAEVPSVVNTGPADKPEAKSLRARLLDYINRKKGSP